MNDLKVIRDERTIAGLMREALFQGRKIVIYEGDTRHEVDFVTIEEASTRSLGSPRRLILSTTGYDVEPPTEKRSLHFSCNFQNFIARWESSISFESSTRCAVELPIEMSLSNSRKSNRLVLATKDTFSSAVLVVTDSVHAEGWLQVDDYSNLGVGGTLSVLPEMPIHVGTKIYGTIRNSTGGLHLSGEIVQVQLRDEGIPQSRDASYSVGIHNPGANELLNTQSAGTIKERRQEVRVPVELPILMTSAFQVKHQVSLRMQDASCVGFKAKLDNPADSILFPIGSMSCLYGSSILAKVIRLNGDLLHFQIAGGSDVDRINWLKLLTPFQNETTTIGTPTGLDILNLFCDSGAAASEYLSNQKRHSADFLDGLSSTAANGQWVHRWIERTKTGEVKGHISAVRTSDQCWYLGDVAGMPSSDRKISDKFLPRFLGYFRDYAVNSSPCPTFLLSWADGHPYWSKYENYLRTEAKRYVLGFAETSYTRLPLKPVDRGVDLKSVSFAWIRASDYEALSSTRVMLLSAQSLFLADAFDFSISCFGSPRLTDALGQNSLRFSRSYALLEVNRASYLVIFQKFPLGTSPLRTGDVPWILPLSNQEIPAEMQSIVSEKVRFEGLKAGYTFPGIMTQFPSSTAPSQRVSKSMLWTLVHPDGLEFLFRDRIVDP